MIARVPDGFVLDPDCHSYDDTPLVFHLDGIPWNEAPVPRRWHRCWIQTWGYAGVTFHPIVNRCPCGATRFPTISEHWSDRNTRRRR